MQSDHKIFDDMARMMTGVFAGAGQVRGELEKDFREKLQEFLNHDLVTRDEFEALRDMLQQQAQTQAAILARLDALEGTQKQAAKTKP